MPLSDFQNLVPQSKKRQGISEDFFTFFVKDAFHVRTFILFGAAAQIALYAFLPFRLALAPAAIFGLGSIVTTVLDTAKSPSNKYMEGVVPGRTSAQLPSPDGRFGMQPAAQPVVVFHFGVRFNHPLGFFAPGARETVDWFTQCNKSINDRADEFGMLGQSTWRAAERGALNSLLIVFYFRDIEGLNKFAHDDIHRKAWDWIVKAGHKHIGFYHEAFCVPAKAYETIYVNYQPLLMGATSVKRTDKDGNDTWIRPIVSADVGPLRSQFKRMGRAVVEGAEE